MQSSGVHIEGCLGVTIRRLSVPRWVRNGTDPRVVLDCEYVYNEIDLKLVVKWFFNDGLGPVYQSIPEIKSREAFGVLQGRLDPSFSVNSRDDYSQYRAIRIPRPTRKLSGKYTCVVASLAGQDARHQDMTVYGECCTENILTKRLMETILELVNCLN
ncbi:hypothetical protein HPB47_022204 [Ixodes persulcatus]|uniref:Uncharacterized protein n=1 Tax=Ixodes persulcatus TaxID=34615 RepID=A0AC60QDP3_IXOPE|nr:hypothetical protein HPB47_022204 [Ixodes persulcatus]